MSWWVSLVDDSQPAWCSFGQADYVPEFEWDTVCSEPCYPTFQSEPFEDGGTYVMGGSTECELNITYNYSRHYYAHLDAENGLRAMHGQRAGDWVERLEQTVNALGTARDDDYWKPTEGNAGAAAARLLAWARTYPQGVWRVS